MAENTIDARGLPCPQPVVMTRAAILEGSAKQLTVIVDDPAQAENVANLARNQGWYAQVDKTDGGDIHLKLVKAAGAVVTGEGDACGVASKVVVLVGGDKFGQGADELGAILMRAFLKTVREVVPRPQKIIFLNTGVKLTVNGSELLPDIQQLADEGISILSCGTCLDFFKMKDQLAVGSISNMFDIATALVSADRVVRL